MVNWYWIIKVVLYMNMIFDFLKIIDKIMIDKNF